MSISIIEQNIFHACDVEHAQEPGLNLFPLEILVHVFSFLSMEERLEITTVCKHWKMCLLTGIAHRYESILHYALGVLSSKLRELEYVAQSKQIDTIRNSELVLSALNTNAIKEKLYNLESALIQQLECLNIDLLKTIKQALSSDPKCYSFHQVFEFIEGEYEIFHEPINSHEVNEIKVLWGVTNDKDIYEPKLNGFTYTHNFKLCRLVHLMIDSQQAYRRAWGVASTITKIREDQSIDWKAIALDKIKEDCEENSSDYEAREVLALLNNSKRQRIR